MATTGIFRYDSKTHILTVDDDMVQSRRPAGRRRCMIISLGILCITTVMVGLIAGAYTHLHSHEENSIIDDPLQAQTYSRAAVAADNPACSKIGKDILKKGGSAVDATIGALICVGVVNIHSLCIAGGGIMLVYDRKKKAAEVFDYREQAPAAITPHIFDKDRNDSMVGGLAVGVPGETRGLRAVWGKYGRLPWRELIQPSIDLARNGFPLGAAVVEGWEIVPIIQYFIYRDAGLREILVDSNGKLKKVGTLIKNEKYARSLERIRDYPDDLYTGELGKQMLKEVKQLGGVMTQDDLDNFKVKQRKPVEGEFNGMKMYTTPLPGGGVLLAHILNVNKGFKYTPEDIDTKEKKAVVIHRFIESLKWSYSYRPYLGDPDVGRNDTQMKRAVAELLDPELAEVHRKKINDRYTYPPSFYAKEWNVQPDHGTTDVCVLDEEGNAVGVTDSINYEFGAKFRSRKTGLIYNNELADFFDIPNSFGQKNIPKANAPGPNKKPLSSKSPTIMTDKNGDVQIIIGASGGIRIPLSTAWVLMLTQWFGMELGHAVREPRPQHYFHPNVINNDIRVPLDPYVIDELKKRGHEIANNVQFGVVQAIMKDKDGIIHAMSDPRKHGHSDGY